MYVLTCRDHRQIIEGLVAARGNLAFAAELIVKSYRSPSSWILGRPTPREIDCGLAKVPLKLARFDLALVADRLRESAL